jgi:putative MFS transporter
VGLLIGFFFKQGGTLGVATFIGVAMVGVILVIAIMGPRTLNRTLEDISK